MPLGRKVDGGSNYKYSNFDDRELRLKRITMNITFEPSWRVQNENRKIFMISLGLTPKKFLALSRVSTILVPIRKKIGGRNSLKQVR
jgi:hypothetical protein